MLWACIGCSALYAPGSPACPQCGSTQYRQAPGGDVEGDAPVHDATPAAGPEAPADVAAKAKPKAADPPSAEPAA